MLLLVCDDAHTKLVLGEGFQLTDHRIRLLAGDTRRGGWGTNGGEKDGATVTNSDICARGKTDEGWGREKLEGMVVEKKKLGGGGGVAWQQQLRLENCVCGEGKRGPEEVGLGWGGDKWWHNGQDREYKRTEQGHTHTHTHATGV